MMLSLLASAVAGSLVGAASAVLSVQVATKTLAVRNGAWRTFADAGRRSPGLNRQAAAVALVGMFALRKEDALYLTADTDHEGRPLDSRYNYVVTGRPLPARWWSFTVYGPDNRLIANEWKRYSLHHANVGLDAQGRYRILFARRSQEADWIPTGTRKFSVFLRLFCPDATLVDDFRNCTLPEIRRLDPP